MERTGNRERGHLWRASSVGPTASFLEYFPLFLSAGPVSSILVNRFGCRTVVMVGGLMSGLSVAAASLANSIVYLYLFIGIIGGTGFDF